MAAPRTTRWRRPRRGHCPLFLDINGNPLSSPQLTIAEGTSSVSFKYEDAPLGGPTLTATALGLTAASQQLTIGADKIVTNANDAGPGSLRDAMLNAIAGNTI